MPPGASSTSSLLGTRRRTEEPENGASASKRPRLETNQEAQARQSSKKRSKKRRRKGPLATTANRGDEGGEEDEEQEEVGTEVGPGLDAKRGHVEEDIENKCMRSRSRSQGEKADARSRPPSPPQESPEEIIANLKAALAAQTVQLARKNDTIQSITNSLTCQICLDYLQKPFAMAPCGHIACYSCLKSWFTAGSNGPNYVHKKKTCPHCRAVIRERPVEVWAVKDAATTLFKAEGAVQVPLVAALPAEVAGAALPVPAATTPDDADPWKHIFRPVYKPPTPGDRPGIADDVDEQEMGMYDAEDQVYRCFDCMHEIWSGECTHCHRAYPGHPADYDDEDDEFIPFPRIPLFDFFPHEEDLTDDEDGFDGFDLPNLYGDGYSDGEEEGEEDGEGDEEAPPMAPSDEEDEDEDALRAAGRRIARLTRTLFAPRHEVIDVSSEEEEEEEAMPVPPRRPNRRRLPAVDSDEEDGDEEGGGVAEVIEIQDDEDDGASDDGFPIPHHAPHVDVLYGRNSGPRVHDPYAPPDEHIDVEDGRSVVEDGDQMVDDGDQVDDDEYDHRHPYYPPDHLDRGGNNYYGQGAFDDDDEEYPDYDGAEDEDEEAGIVYPSDEERYSDEEY